MERKAKILMVEDESDVLSLNREHFEGQGYDVITAATLAEARVRLDSAPDLILLDVMLPDGMGWDFAPEIRLTTNAPVIFLTCRDENESVIKGLLQGGDDYITKPYDLNILSARVAAALRRTGFALAGMIELPPLRIDILAGTAELGGEKINLSQREMQLLCCFVISAGRSIKCEEIYRRVWGEPVGDYARTIAVYVSYLRQKLKLAENGLFEIRSTTDQEYIFSKISYGNFS